jgi:hypothetical protein
MLNEIDDVLKMLDDDPDLLAQLADPARCTRL